MTDPNFFILACHGLLGLKKPVEVRIKMTKKPLVGGAAAWYEERMRKGKTVSHVITIDLRTLIGSRYTMVDVIAHEMCHAAQVEHGIFNHEHHHDEKFQALCRYLKKECAKIGFPLGRLYSKETDTE